MAAVPDGVYFGEDYIDDGGGVSGSSDEPIVIKATVTVSGDSIDVNFDGSAPQVKANINNPFASTVGATASVVKSVLTSDDIPFNSGASRAITVSAPYGSILNPSPPSALRSAAIARLPRVQRGHESSCKRVADRVVATGYDTTTSACLSHLGDKGYSIYLEIFGGGLGAGPSHDGCDGVDCPLSNCSNIPVEAMDMAYDFFRVVDYSLVPDSAGAGRWRGGLGLQRIYEILSDDVAFATYGIASSCQLKVYLAGTQGGAETFVERDGEAIELGSKQSFNLRPGDRLVLRTGGGGGYGEPGEREPVAHELDVRDGLVA